VLTFAALIWQRLKAASGRLPAYVKGPKPESWILGSQAEVALSEAGEANRRWQAKFGTVYKYDGCFGDEYLVLNDAHAIQHVLKGQTTSYVLDKSLREFLRLVTGEGLIWADDADHARQRRLLSPAFNPAFIKSLAPTFANCASRLVAQWNKRIDAEGDANGSWSFNAYHWMELLTMESLGSTAFGIHFGTLEGKEHPLQQAYAGLLQTTYARPSKLDIALGAAVLHIPAWLVHHLQKLPIPGIAKLKNAQKVGRSFAHELIGEKRKRLQDSSQSTDKDFLSVLVRAGEKNQKGNLERMPDEEIYNNLTTFWIAGFDTATVTTCFALIELARNPELQEKLASELVGILGSAADCDLPEGLSADEMEKMPYLGAVINETLRCHAPIHSGLFKAAFDDVIPLSSPIKTADGQVDGIPVKAGQSVTVSFEGFNRSPEVWGPDANEFRPERWLRPDANVVDPAKQCGGMHANVATFGGGPKGCIGWRFAVLETCIFLAAIVRDFEISLAQPEWELWRDPTYIGTIPMKKGLWTEGAQCPIQIRRRRSKA